MSLDVDAIADRLEAQSQRCGPTAGVMFLGKFLVGALQGSGMRWWLPLLLAGAEWTAADVRGLTCDSSARRI